MAEPLLMQKVAPILEGIDDFSSESVEKEVKAWITNEELSFGKIMAPLRLVIVGDLKGPHLFDIMTMIGKEESISGFSLKNLSVTGHNYRPS